MIRSDAPRINRRMHWLVQASERFAERQRAIAASPVGGFEIVKMIGTSDDVELVRRVMEHVGRHWRDSYMANMNNSNLTSGH